MITGPSQGASYPIAIDSLAWAVVGVVFGVCGQIGDGGGAAHRDQYSDTEDGAGFGSA